MLNALIIRGGKFFVGLIFVVEGTHENFCVYGIYVCIISAYKCCVFDAPSVGSVGSSLCLTSSDDI